MRHCLHCLLIAGIAALPAKPAWAQTATPLDENRVDREQPVAGPQDERPSIAPPSAETLTSVETGEQSGAAIRTIRFVGTSVPAVVGEAAQDFVGLPATPENLRALTKSLSAAYRKSNVALFTIVVPQQDLSSGEVKVLVAEGYIETVAIEGEADSQGLALVRSYAAKLTGGQVTSRSRLERYLSLIRDIPGLKVTSRLELGSKRGAVRLVLKLDQEKPRLLLSYDNRSTRLIDQGQVQAKARAYGLLRSGDLTELTGTASVNFKDLKYIGLAHSTPLGSEGARLLFSAGHLETRPSGSPLSGNAETFGLRLTYPLIRSYRRNLTGSLALDGVNSDNTAFGSILASEKTRAVRAALGYSQASPKSSLSGGITASHGLDILGADTMSLSGEATFFKLNARASYTRQIGKALFARLETRGQWSKDALPAIERFTVGGEDIGRAFEKGLLSTDRGIAGSAELAVRPLSGGDFKLSEIYAFADYAYVGLLARPTIASQTFDLGSAGGGVRLGWRENMMIGLEAARTIDKPYPAYASQWRISVNWRVKIKG